jgi:hypothetical protein
MKKLILIIPLSLLFLHFMYEIGGWGVWTTDFTTYGRIITVTVSPSPQSLVFAGSLDSGVIKSTNSGATWFTSNTGLAYKHVQCFAISKSNPGIIYLGTDSLSGAASTKGVYKSTDSGATWTNVTNDGFTEDRSIQAITIDPTNPNIVYAGIFNATHNTVQGVWKTTNGGTNWSIANTGLGINKNILALAIDPSNPNIVYLGTSFLYSPNTGPTYVYKSTNAGVSWTNSSTGLPSTTADINPVRWMDISTTNPQYVCAGLFQNTTSGGFYFSTNAGTSWTKMHAGLPSVAGANIRWVLFRPGTTTEMYCAMDALAPNAGVYRTTNSASSWTSFVGGTLTNSYLTRTLSFRATSSDSTLYTGVGTTSTASTPGQGVYEYSFPLVGVSNQNGNIPKEFALHQNFPNPFNPATFIRYDVPRQTLVRIDVFDASGRVVSTLVNETKSPGSYEVVFDASSHSSGVYFYKITAGDFAGTMKMIVLK